MHRCQVLPGQVQNEAPISSPALSASRTGTQAHVLTLGGLQHRSGPEMHQEVDRHADVDHDQSHRSIRPRSRARDQQPYQESRLQQRPLRSRVRPQHQQQSDGGSRTGSASAKTSVRRPEQTASTAKSGSLGHARKTIFHRGRNPRMGNCLFCPSTNRQGRRVAQFYSIASKDFQRCRNADHWTAVLLQIRSGSRSS